MDVTIKVSTGGGKKQNNESKSITIKEVQTIDQVKEALETSYKDYFRGVTTLVETKPRAKKNTV